MYHIAAKKKTFADPFLMVDNGIYKSAVVQKRNELEDLCIKPAHGKCSYDLVGYMVLRLQHGLFLNPNGIDGMGPPFPSIQL